MSLKYEPASEPLHIYVKYEEVSSARNGAVESRPSLRRSCDGRRSVVEDRARTALDNALLSSTVVVGPSLLEDSEEEAVGVERPSCSNANARLTDVNVQRFRGGLVFKAHRLVCITQL